MSYATLHDVVKGYKPVENIIGNLPQQISSSEVCSLFILRQESIIDAYLARRYAVPLNPVPALINQVASDLSLFAMLAEKNPEVPDFLQPRYDRSIKILEMLRDGEMDLTSQTLVSTGDSEAWSSTQDFHPIFDPSLDAIDQRVDKDQVDDAKADRIDDI